MASYDPSQDVSSRLNITSPYVKNLTVGDFELDVKELIALKYDDCILVLFHTENTESQQLALIWAAAARQIAGPIFASINILSERKVAENFTRLKMDGSHPLHWAALRQYPFIMVYRKRWPVAVYNGPREVQSIIDYALTLACEANYYEPAQLGGSMQAENRIEMGPYDPYINLPDQPSKIIKVSSEFGANKPVRGFDPNIAITQPGTAESQQSANVVASEQQSRNTTGGTASRGTARRGRGRGRASALP